MGAEAVPPPSSAPKGGQGGMPTDFLGFLDVNTTFGSIAASLIVAGGFCVLVELVKFVDKSPSTPSVFGSLWSAVMCKAGPGGRSCQLTLSVGLTCQMNASKLMT